VAVDASVQNTTANGNRERRGPGANALRAPREVARPQEVQRYSPLCRPPRHGRDARSASPHLLHSVDQPERERRLRWPRGAAYSLAESALQTARIASSSPRPSGTARLSLLA